MDNEAVLVEKVRKANESGTGGTYEESEARAIQLLIENETFNKKAFAFKHAGKDSLTCVQNAKVDPFTPKARSRLGF